MDENPYRPPNVSSLVTRRSWIKKAIVPVIGMAVGAIAGLFIAACLAFIAWARFTGRGAPQKRLPKN
jgi:hypothetical protein